MPRTACLSTTVMLKDIFGIFVGGQQGGAAGPQPKAKLQVEVLSIRVHNGSFVKKQVHILLLSVNCSGIDPA